MKTLHIFILIMIIMALGCRQQYQKDFDTKANNNEQFISLDSFKINGIVPIETTKEKMLKLFGIPEIEKISINETCAYIYEADSVTYYKYGDTIFEGFQDSVFLTNLSLQSTENINLYYGKTLLNKPNYLREFLKLFPNADVEKKNDTQMVRLRFGEFIDGACILIFKNDTLIEFIYWLPC